MGQTKEEGRSSDSSISHSHVSLILPWHKTEAHLDGPTWLLVLIWTMNGMDPSQRNLLFRDRLQDSCTRFGYVHKRGTEGGGYDMKRGGQYMKRNGKWRKERAKGTRMKDMRGLLDWPLFLNQHWMRILEWQLISKSTVVVCVLSTSSVETRSEAGWSADYPPP